MMKRKCRIHKRKRKVKKRDPLYKFKAGFALLMELKTPMKFRSMAKTLLRVSILAYNLIRFLYPAISPMRLTFVSFYRWKNDVTIT